MAKVVNNPLKLTKEMGSTKSVKAICERKVWQPMIVNEDKNFYHNYKATYTN
jgi:hypothetical protein